MGATERINVRVQILGCRVWVRPRLANDPHFAEHWARIRVCQNSWTPAAWASRVRSELRAKWGGGTHGGVGRGGGAHGGIRRTNKQRAGARKPAPRVRTESVSGDHTGCRQHADVSRTGHVASRSLEVSGVSFTGLDVQISGSGARAGQPAAPRRADTGRPLDAVVICARAAPRVRTESASGDHAGCGQHADASCTGRVTPRSLEVSGVSFTGLHALISGSGTRVGQPAAPRRADTGRSPNALVIRARALAKTTTGPLMEKLGEGSYGQVYKCKLRGRTMAVKIKQCTHGPDREVAILKGLGDAGGHPAVVPLCSWRKRHASGQMFLYFPLFSQDLKDYQRKHIAAQTSIGYRSVLRLAARLCAGVLFMHSRCVLHRDLKPRNILMRPEKIQPAANQQSVLDECAWYPVVCDFGNACQLVGQAPTMPSRKYCTLPYCAPEVLIPFMRYTWPSDVWSMGLVLAEVEHLYPVALGSSPVRSNVAQLLVLWKLCQPAAAQLPLGAFASRVKRELACYHGGDISATMGNGPPHPTLGRVYGVGFANLVRTSLRMDPDERSTARDLHDECVHRLRGAGRDHAHICPVAMGVC